MTTAPREEITVEELDAVDTQIRDDESRGHMSALLTHALVRRLIAAARRALSQAGGEWWADSTTFQKAIREYREQRGTSQQDFALSMGISAQYQCDLEGGRRMPSVSYVERLCERHGSKPGGAGHLNWHTLGAKAHGWQVRVSSPSESVCVGRERPKNKIIEGLEQAIAFTQGDESMGRIVKVRVAPQIYQEPCPDTPQSVPPESDAKIEIQGMIREAYEEQR